MISIPPDVCTIDTYMMFNIVVNGFFYIFIIAFTNDKYSRRKRKFGKIINTYMNYTKYNILYLFLFSLPNQNVDLRENVEISCGKI